MGRGRIVCEGTECARQAVGIVNWRPWRMYLESQGARRRSHSRGRGGGRGHAYRCGHRKPAGAQFAALRKADLHKGLASPLDEWDLGETQRAHPFEWKLRFSGDRERWLRQGLLGHACACARVLMCMLGCLSDLAVVGLRRKHSFLQWQEQG